MLYSVTSKITRTYDAILKHNLLYSRKIFTNTAIFILRCHTASLSNNTAIQRSTLAVFQIMAKVALQFCSNLEYSAVFSNMKKWPAIQQSTLAVFQIMAKVALQFCSNLEYSAVFSNMKKWPAIQQSTLAVFQIAVSYCQPI